MINYSVLRDIQKRELESSALAKLDNDFYQKVGEFLTVKKKEATESGSLLAIREYENLRKIILMIQAKREEKIALMAVRGERANPALTREESEMLEKIYDIIDDSRGRVVAAWGKTPSSSRRIRVLKHVEQYKGLDNKLYGPFNPGDEQSLPSAEADWLLKARMAEIA